MIILSQLWRPLSLLRFNEISILSIVEHEPFIESDKRPNSLERTNDYLSLIPRPVVFGVSQDVP